MDKFEHFDIACEDVARAKRFYEKMFGWKIEEAPGDLDYHLIETGGVGGGMGVRRAPEQRITNYVGVEDIDAAVATENIPSRQIKPIPKWIDYVIGSRSEQISECGMTDSRSNCFDVGCDTYNIGCRHASPGCEVVMFIDDMHKRLA
jgi:hypothetical protein